MAFFYPRTVYQSQASFSPVFHLFGSSSRSPQCPRRTRDTRHAYRTIVRRPWQPRFNVKETEDAYIVNGELPGWNKDQVSVEFPEAQKLVITGSFDQTQDVSATTDAPVEQPQREESAAPTVSSETEYTVDADAQSVSSEGKSVSSYQATVEDAEDDDDFEMIDSDKKETTQQEKEAEQTPAPEEEEHAAEEPTQEEPTAKADQPRARRSVTFSRYVNFPAEVDYDAVSANIKDGLLRIVVPKAKRPEPRRIAIN